MNHTLSVKYTLSLIVMQAPRCAQESEAYA